MDAILIPYRGTSGSQREKNLAFVLNWYRPLGIPMTLGDDGSEPFNRSGSRNAAAAGAGEWDVALFADADTVADLDVVRKAFDLARLTDKLIIPHDDFRRLTQLGTQRMLRDPRRFIGYPRGILKLTAGAHVGRAMAPCGALVVSRKAFNKIGRWDPGFIGWGYEDTAFLNDAERTVGVTRIPGYLWHLWHPRPPGWGPSTAHNRALAKTHAGA